MGQDVFHKVILLKARPSWPWTIARMASKPSTYSFVSPPSSWKWFFSSLNLTNFSWKQLPLALVLQGLVNGSYPVFKPLWVLKGWKRVFSGFSLLSDWATPTLSAFLHRIGVSLVRLFSWPSSGPVWKDPCLSSLGAIVQVECHDSRREQGNLLSGLADHPSFNEAQNAICFLNWKHRLKTPV